MKTVADVNAIIAAFMPLVVHSRKVAQDIAELRALQEDCDRAALANDLASVIPLETLAKLKGAVDGFLAEVEPKAETITARELK